MRIIDVEQNSPEWFAARAGLPTASEFKKLVSGTGKVSTQIGDYARTLAGELYAGKPLDRWEGNQWTEQGHERESMAAGEYALIHDVELSEVGLCLHDSGDFGCSPDRLVGDSGILEIKSLSAPKHIAALQYIDKHGDIPPDYRSQVQGEMLVTDRKWCDLMFYHPDLPSEVYRVEPDTEFRDLLTEQIKAVIAERDAIHKFLNKEAA